MSAATTTGPRWPPDKILRAMLREGCDTWIATIIGVHSATVAGHRARLGVKPRGRGGSAHRRNLAQDAWRAKWAPTLHQLGLL